jgi:4-amino-4-deoxy-L-arabinose transferase-like glycosyltransferase
MPIRYPAAKRSGGLVNFIDRVMNLEKREALRFFLLVLAAFTALELLVIWGTPFNLAPDEAHYWEWSRRLDRSYYSKGPVIAYLIRGACTLFGDTEFGVRAVAVFSQLLFAGVLFAFLLEVSTPAVALIAVVVVRSSLLFWEMSVVASTDPPFSLFWLLALWCGYRAVKLDKSLWWLASFFFIALGGLTKYTAYLFIVGALFFLLFSSRRRHLWRSGFLGGVGLVFLTVFPLVAWNAHHGWVNFSHNWGHIGGEKATWGVRYLGELVAGQFGLIGPLLFVAVLLGYFYALVAWRKGDEVLGFFVATALPLILLCVAVSLRRRVYANWPMPIYINGIIVLAIVLSRLDASVLRRWLVPTLAINALFLVVAHLVSFGVTFGMPVSVLPTKKLVGWETLGRHSAALAQNLNEPFFVAENYDVASELAFYGGLPAFCAHVDGRRMNQYDLWGGWGANRGRSALLVFKDPASAEKIRPFFDSVERVPEPLEITYGGTIVRTFHFFLARTYSGAEPSVPSRY